MESTPKKAPRSKFPALLVVALALVALVFVIWRVDSAPSTNDAYASADTIDVVPEVSGRIVELAVTDNQAVKQGDLLFRIDPRPYEANLAKAEASLAALDKQIMLTQRSVDAQQFGADSVNATVEKARAAAKQATLAPNIAITFTGDINKEVDYEKIGPVVAQILQDELETEPEGIYE